MIQASLRKMQLLLWSFYEAGFLWSERGISCEPGTKVYHKLWSTYEAGPGWNIGNLKNCTVIHDSRTINFSFQFINLIPTINLGLHAAAKFFFLFRTDCCFETERLLAEAKLQNPWKIPQRGHHCQYQGSLVTLTKPLLDKLKKLSGTLQSSPDLHLIEHRIHMYGR